MIDQEIVNYVNSAFFGDANSAIQNLQKSENFPQDRKNSVVRLLKSYVKMLQAQITKVDFEIVLRDFLILFHSELHIPNYQPSTEFGNLGLFINNDTVWASACYPDYVNAKFATRVARYSSINYSFESSNNNLQTNGYIKNLTGFTNFKSEEQKLTVTGALKTPAGFTTLIAMSTGGGKSLITQTVSFQKNSGLTIVVVPTISLMMDQVRNAKAIIRHSTDNEIFYYHSAVNIHPIITAIKKRTARLLFVSPEALVKNEVLINTLNEVNSERYINNFIIDEAHIINEWGASFRVDFQCLDAIRRRWMAQNSALRTFLLSATFSEKTVDQLKHNFSEDGNWIEIRCDKLRTEIHYDIIKTSSFSQKKERTFELVRLLPHPMIVYVNRPDEAVNLQDELFKQGIINTRVFTGRTDSNNREKIINEWIEDEFSIMIATCAFGVGVDKKDVRTVLHTYLPDNPSKYYQEAGRGGRDGLSSLSVMLYTKNDLDAAFSFTSKVLTSQKLIGRWFSMLNCSRTKKLAANTYIIDTSVKPSYSDKDDDYGYGNDADVNWNVITVLLLRRHGLIEIQNFEFSERYFFTIKLLTNTISYQNENAERLLSDIREQEWADNLADYQEMASAVSKTGRICWSEMFNNAFMYTDAFCAGCNAHNEAYCDCSSKFPLKKKVGLIQENPIELDRFLSNAKCGMLFGCDDHVDLLSKLCTWGIKAFVNFNMANNNATLADIVEWSLHEFYEVVNGKIKFEFDSFYAIMLPESQFELSKILSIIEHSQGANLRFLLVSKEDVFIAERNKKMTEIINGPCYHWHILEAQNVR